MSRLMPLCLLLAACGREPGGDPMRVVPADAAVAAVAPSLATMRAKVTSFLAGIEGASGALDLLADRYGLDLRTAEGTRSLGLDPDKGVALFARGDAAERAWVGTASVSDPERFLAEVRSRLEKVAGATLAAGQPAEPPAGGAWLFDGPTNAAWRAALGVTNDRIGVLLVAPAASDTIALWNTVASGRAEASFVASERAASAKAALGEPVVMLVLEGLLPDAPASLGLARGIVQGVRDALPTFVGGIAMPATGAGDAGGGDVGALVVKLSAAHVKEGTLPVKWVRPGGSPDRLARAFPKTTTAFVRARVALDDVRALPSFLRESILPERLPGLEALPLPNVSDLIDLVDGDVAVGLLGLDAGANLGSLSGVLRDPRRALDVFHVALAARLRDAAAAKRTFAGIAAQLGTSGWTVAPIGGGAGAKPDAFEGWSLVHQGRHHAVLIDDQVAVFIVGAGEVDAFLAAKEGRALALASFAEGSSATVGQALGVASVPAQDASALGLVASPLRLARELDARGLPPYFLRIINDVRLFSATVGASEKRLDLALEIGL